MIEPVDRVLLSVIGMIVLVAITGMLSSGYFGARRYEACIAHHTHKECE